MSTWKSHLILFGMALIWALGLGLVFRSLSLAIGALLHGWVLYPGFWREKLVDYLIFSGLLFAIFWPMILYHAYQHKKKLEENSKQP